MVLEYKAAFYDGAGVFQRLYKISRVAYAAGNDKFFSFEPIHRHT